MIQHASPADRVTRHAPMAPRTTQLGPLLRQKFEAWTRSLSRTPLERAIDAEVRRRIGHASEPGDIAMVNMIVEEMARSFRS